MNFINNFVVIVRNILSRSPLRINKFIQKKEKKKEKRKTIGVV